MLSLEPEPRDVRDVEEDRQREKEREREREENKCVRKKN